MVAPFLWGVKPVMRKRVDRRRTARRGCIPSAIASSVDDKESGWHDQRGLTAENGNAWNHQTNDANQRKAQRKTKITKTIYQGRDHDPEDRVQGWRRCLCEIPRRQCFDNCWHCGCQGAGASLHLRNEWAAMGDLQAPLVNQETYVRN